jgi:hypothetical protein
MVENLKEKLIPLLNENVLGIIWITNHHFKDLHENFEILDYLFDGLLGLNRKEFQKGNLKESSSHLLLSQHFGKTFFLGQTVYSSNLQEQILSFSKVINDEERKKIIVINDSSHKVDMQKSHPSKTELLLLS